MKNNDYIGRDLCGGSWYHVQAECLVRGNNEVDICFDNWGFRPLRRKKP